MPGEFDLIDWIRSRQTARPRVVIGVGDDLAALRWEGDDLLLVGVDQVMDGVHFDAAVHSPRDIAKKAMNRNLSDCAAMACLPAAAVATVALPRDVGIDFARELVLGLDEAAAPFDCPVVGGDTGVWPGRLLLTVTILGRSAGLRPVTRSGARPGDHLYLTGPLGGSLLGRHLSFAPRVHLARDLARRHTITSMIDLSDGLSRDLPHLCAGSGVGALVDAALVPVHPDVRRLPASGRSDLEHALHDGEDYELLFTSPDGPIDGAILVGEMTASRAILLRAPAGDAPLAPLGWEHAL